MKNQIEPMNTELNVDELLEIEINKTFCKELKGTLQKIQNSVKSRERSLTITKVQEAIMWLEMDSTWRVNPNLYPIT